jgi:hypothetical protein
MLVQGTVFLAKDGKKTLEFNTKIPTGKIVKDLGIAAVCLKL